MSALAIMIKTESGDTYLEVLENPEVGEVQVFVENLWYFEETFSEYFIQFSEGFDQDKADSFEEEMQDAFETNQEQEE